MFHMQEAAATATTANDLSLNEFRHREHNACECITHASAAPVPMLYANSTVRSNCTTNTVLTNLYGPLLYLPHGSGPQPLRSMF